MSATVIFNTIMGGLLTGLVYGLAALGFSLIFAVNRVANLALGGLMVAGMGATSVFAARRGVDCHGDAAIRSAGHLGRAACKLHRSECAGAGGGCIAAVRPLAAAGRGAPA